MGPGFHFKSWALCPLEPRAFLGLVPKSGPTWALGPLGPGAHLVLGPIFVIYFIKHVLDAHRVL